MPSTDAAGPGVFLLSWSLSLEEEPQSAINQVYSIFRLGTYQIEKKTFVIENSEAGCWFVANDARGTFSDGWPQEAVALIPTSEV